VTGLVRAELLKVRSVRVTLALVGGCLAFVALNVVALVLASGQRGAPPLTDPATARSVFASAGAASALVLVIGILGMTTEYRYQTVTPTFLVTPRRSRVLTAKLVVHALVGLAVGAACVVLAVALALSLLPLRHHAPVPATAVLQVAGGTLLAYAVYCVLGVCVGALIRNQVAAIVVALLWTVIAEGLVVAFLPRVGRWLPGGALAGVLQRPTLNGDAYLPVWAAVAVLLGYVAAFGLLAARTTLRRDVT
jgi:ABC-2 type transport system permease protein